MYKKKVLIISNFHEDVAVSRTNMSYKFFKSVNFDSKVLYSNFSHSSKKFRKISGEDFISIKTISYSSNLSLKRIISHLIFAINVYKYLKIKKFDLIYFNIPPNSLSIPILLLKKKETKIIIDVIDLWPESIPINNKFLKYLFNFFVGGFFNFIRNRVIKISDFCITESQYFSSKLKLGKNHKTIFLKKHQNCTPVSNCFSEFLSIAYLGNIGKIYDFDSLIEIFKKVKKNRKIKLHIIGDGQKKEYLMNKLDLLNIDYVYHGLIFDEERKRKILENCWFGYNGYKSSSEVALSYKSVDYLSYGLPLINSAKGDTKNLIQKHNIGLNFEALSLAKTVKYLSSVSFQDVVIKKRESFRVFKLYFSGKSYDQDMREVINSLKLLSS